MFKVCMSVSVNSSSATIYEIVKHFWFSRVISISAQEYKKDR